MTDALDVELTNGDRVSAYFRAASSLIPWGPQDQFDCDLRKERQSARRLKGALFWFCPKTGVVTERKLVSALVETGIAKNFATARETIMPLLDKRVELYYGIKTRLTIENVRDTSAAPRLYRVSVVPYEPAVEIMRQTLA